jgi:hypothetical protein
MAESQKSREADDDERDDERDDADEREDDQDEDASPAKAPNVAGAANVEAARSGSDAADDDDAPAPAATPAKKAAALGGPKPKKAKVKKRAVSVAAPTGGARVAAQPITARQPGALGKSLVLFVIVVGGLAAGFALLGRDGDNKAPAVPKWAVGQTVDVEITVVPSDRQDLACASKDELAGRHCQFEERNRPWKSADADEKILKPYTTTDRVQFLAAGLWDQPALKGKLPTSRFSVKCKYKVEGKLAKPWIRWAADGQWFERVDDWYAGPVTDCTIAQ